MIASANDIIGVIATALRVKPSAMQATTTNRDVSEWDSLGHLRVCLALEEHFGVTIDMNDMADLTSVARLMAYVEKHERR